MVNSRANREAHAKAGIFQGISSLILSDSTQMTMMHSIPIPVSYTHLDVYKRQQLIAGPIVKYSDISRELHERKITLAQIQDGVAIFILGLGSKVLIANSVGALWTELSTDIGFANISTILAWLGLAAFTLQIYFDFSGYSLMAIGLGKMLGFTFPQNFNYPYISRSVTEFWRRWHMTLSGWFKEYVYIPLGGSRCSPGRNL